MIVIYQDVGGCHSSAVAANIHANKLPIDKVPTEKELLTLPTFDKLEKKDTAHLIYIGKDEFGSAVYTISRRYKPNMVLNPLTDMYKVLNGDTDGLYIINTDPTVNTLMKIGGFSSRQLHLVSFGRPIVTYGTLKAYNKIADLVRQIKEQIRLDLEHKNRLERNSYS
ncbi:DUF3189 family protein [Fonticella tunisiensis]|uniref:Uncharacterized protein DUF3189 n=1 Tax=Fonticella tunisiensis TaxID=1096341 RepID=A0A4R7KC42_9CLOT|nr:DUF3189 family protein [Fonticella tunisiensis]TDT51361.1 uncharacterized protein DUF3189 [Fonticella tunisiensis]